MLLKIFLVFLSAALAVADIESDYIEISRQRDAQAIQSYFLSEDPLSLRLQWDQIWARLTYIILLGKQKALEQADISQVEQVKKDWAFIEELDAAIQFELKNIVDSLRSRALIKAPIEWEQLTQLGINFIEETKKAAAEGNARNLKNIKFKYVKIIREANLKIRAIVESQF